MESYHKLKKMLCKELENVVDDGKISAGNLEVIDKLTHSIKSLDAIMAMEESGYSREGGYSGRRDSMGRYADGASYNNGGSGGSYARYNDGMEQSGYSGRRYSREEGKANMISQLQALMQEAPSSEEREVLQRAMSKLKDL